MKRRTHIQRRKKCKTTGKLCYPSQAEAIRSGKVLILLGRWLGKEPRAYFCRDCHKWHLTKMKQPEDEGFGKGGVA